MLCCSCCVSMAVVLLATASAVPTCSAQSCALAVPYMCHVRSSGHFVTCRGKFRSKSWQGVVEEAKELVRSGVKELNLIAEDTNQYGVPIRLSLHSDIEQELFVA